MNQLLTSFTRFNIKQSAQKFCLENVILTSTKFFNTSACLYAEPLKKKKRIDPQVIKAREDRRRKKLEKQIRRLEKSARQLKPLEELEVPLTLIDEKSQRTRDVQIQLHNQQLEKEWAKYQLQQHLRDLKMIDSLIASQQKALDELRLESEELYQEAISIDPHLLPFTTIGPVATPPIKNYDSPDGDYQDISKKWN